MAEMTGGAGGPFALIQPFFGESAQDKIRHYLDQQAAANAGAVAGDPNAPFSGAYTTPPTGGGLPTTKPPPMGVAQPGPGEPTLMKTPESWGSMLMDLQQQNEAQAGFNQSIGLGLSAFSQPRDREMVAKMFNPATAPPDPFKMGESLMNMSSMQQGQDRANMIARMVNDPTQGPQIAAKLHMDWGALKAAMISDPGTVTKIAQALGMPTDALRNLTQLQNMGGAATPEMKDITSGVVSTIAGPDNAAMIQAQTAWRNAHKGQPDSAMPWTPNDLASFNQWQVDEKQRQGDRLTASSELPDKNESAMTLQNDLQELKDSPGLKTIMTSPGHRELALKALNDGTVTDIPSIAAKWSLSNDEAKAVALLRRIGGATTETAMRGMAGTGTRVTQSEVGPLKDAITMTQNLNQSYEDYIHGAINNAITKTKRQISANFGNTGNVTNMPAEYAPWLNDAFKKGGQLYKEGSGVDALPAAQPVPDSEIAQGKALLKDKPYLRDEMLDNWQQRGFDTSKLRSSLPSKW